MNIIYVVMPAYNESENIRTVIDEWYTVVERHNEEGKSRLLIVDDGSKDHTYEILKQEATKRPLLIIKSKKNSGHGDTVIDGYRYAIQAGADYIFQTDSDGQTRPEEFESFWENRQKYEAIIGYRNHREDGISRVFVTKVLRFVVYLCFHQWVKDANTPYRLMKRDTLIQYLKLMPKHFNLPNVVLAVAYVRFSKNRTLFLPITFRKRQGGVNSINLKNICIIGKQAIMDFVMIRRRMDAFENRE